MDSVLKEAYIKIFENEPIESMKTWEVAEKIMSNWNVPKMGESLARNVIFRVVNHTEYPNDDISRNVIGTALEFSTELWDDLPDEPHVDQLAYKEYQELYK